MITNGAEELPESLATTVTDTLLLDEALMVLRKYSLVEAENEKLSIHRLVQAVIRHAINEEEFKALGRHCRAYSECFFPVESDDVRTWSVCASCYYRTHQSLYHTPNQFSLPQKTARLLIDWLLNQIAAKKMYESIAIGEALAHECTAHNRQRNQCT